ncbi:MAG: carbon-nitrogen family hydrolase [Clostridia bacterium]|nr:carbon-nitrogen family hydrolase [Clostridia bacterium]
MRIATLQLPIDDISGIDGRFRLTEELLLGMERSGRRPDLLMLPEIWGCGFFDYDRYKDCCEDVRGRTYEFFSGWAKRLGCWVHTGSFIEKRGEDYYNTCLLLDRKGEIAAQYSKIHLFTYKSREFELFKPGTEVVVTDSEFGRVGLSICYDLRFPEQYRKMVDMGAEILLICAEWPVQRLPHWRLLCQTRALENQCIIVACNASGTQGGVPCAGHSMTVNPYGKIYFEADADACVLWSEIDPAEVPKAREHFPVLRDRVDIR